MIDGQAENAPGSGRAPAIPVLSIAAGALLVALVILALALAPLMIGLG